MPTSYLVLGAGAIGGTVGAGLVRDGHEVLFCDVDEAHVAAIAGTGLTISGPVEQFTIRAAACTPDGLPARIDRTVLLAVKAQHTPAAAALLHDRLAPTAHVVTMQNGLTADAVAAEVGRDRVVPAFVNFGADYLGPGRIIRGNRGSFRVGELDGTLTERVRTFAADVPDVEVTDSILGYEWAKIAYGAMLFATAVSDASIADSLADPAFGPLFLALAAEVLSRAPVPPMPFDGFDPLDLPGSLDRLTTFNRASAKSHSGVYRDLAVRHRPTEVDAQLGFLAVSSASSPGSPLIARLVALVHAIEDGRRVCERANLELLAAHERLERLGRPLNALAHVVAVPDRAPAGPLHGVAVAVKDLVAVRDVPTRYGSNLPDAQPAAVDATLVARLRAAGADVLAVTQCLEYAAGFAHPAVGDTRNPRDPAVTAGGSSGGSAAVVGAGAVDLAVGTDTGGSIRIPAAYCGVVGLKPTRGLVSEDGVFPLAPSCDTVGPLTSDVRGAAVLLAVLADRPELAMATDRAQRLPRPRIGVLRGQLDDACLTPEVATALTAALARLAGAGFDLVEVSAGWAARCREWEAVLSTVVLFEAAAVHAERLRTLRSSYGPGTLALLDAGAAISETDYRSAVAEADDLARLVEDSLTGLDALAGPTAPFVAPEHDPPFGSEESPEGWFTGVYNLTGHPALSLPVPTPGLPVGLQLAGAYGADATLLSVAAAVEAALQTSGPA
jgi:2-dehydropantoate 2-reductase